MAERFPVPALADGHIHVWTAQIDPAPADLLERTVWLSRDERERAARFYFDPDRQRYIAARATLRQLLAGYMHLLPGKISFSYGARGKPEVVPPADAQPISFNVSHRGALALYAFTINREIGIDVEQLREVPEALAIARNHFTPAETKLLEQANNPTTLQECFFRLWTRKEAVIKAVGTGLAMPLDEFDVSSGREEPDAWRTVEVPARPETSWSVRDLVIAPGYRGALCVAGSPVEIQHCGSAALL